MTQESTPLTRATSVGARIQISQVTQKTFNLCMVQLHPKLNIDIGRTMISMPSLQGARSFQLPFKAMQRLAIAGWNETIADVQIQLNFKKTSFRFLIKKNSQPKEASNSARVMNPPNKTKASLITNRIRSCVQKWICLIDQSQKN